MGRFTNSESRFPNSLGFAVTGAGLYIHVPFCRSVCPYCDFAVLIAGEERRELYLEGIEVEASMYHDLGCSFDTVYLGGGTPSSLEPGQLDRILRAVRSHLPVKPDAELFLEVNPEDVTEESVAAWRTLGFDTVSIGVQSFDDAALRFFDRNHSAAAACRAVDLARSGGFRTVSIDLIYAYQGQTTHHWRGQLEQAVARSVDHLSCYQLTVHHSTVFGGRKERGQIHEPPESLQAELFTLTHSFLAATGYEGYEVSNFAASPRHRSRHNVKYWNHSPYLGLAPAAHSFYGRRRWWNRRKIRLWQRDIDAGRRPVEGEESLSRDQLAMEAVMLGLRTADGIDLDFLRARFGVELVAANREVVDRLVTNGCVSICGGRLRPTMSGMLIADALAGEFEVSTNEPPSP
jgi:oxygen-independent coproporphyrinogen-3 oxidase